MTQNQRPSPIPPPRPPAPLSKSPAPSSKCINCGSEDKWILHQVRFRGLHRRLCTTCVLKLHPADFCPVCFLLHESPSAANKRFTCTKCSSITHPHCLSPSAAAGAIPFLCLPCTDPSGSYFDERPHALLVLCASRISAASMAKALLVARANADRHVRDAAIARKRAREAIDNLAIVVARTPASAEHRPPLSS